MANTSVFIPVITPVTTDASLTGDGSVGSPLAVVSGGIVAPGADTQVVYNDNAVLGADAGLIYNAATDTLGVGAGVSLTGAALNVLSTNQMDVKGRGFDVTVRDNNGSNAGSFAGAVVDAQTTHALAAGTVNNVRGLTATAASSSDATGVTTNVVAALLTALVDAGPATNLYGLKIATVTGGSTANYAIYTDSGDVSFGDDVSIRSPGNLSAIGTANVFVVPTADPHVVGALWNDTGTLKVSAG